MYKKQKTRERRAWADGELVPESVARRRMANEGRIFWTDEFDAMYDLVYVTLSKYIVGRVIHHMVFHLMPFLAPEESFRHITRLNGKEYWFPPCAGFGPSGAPMESLLREFRMNAIPGFARQRQIAAEDYDGMDGAYAESEVEYERDEGDEDEGDEWAGLIWHTDEGDEFEFSPIR